MKVTSKQVAQWAAIRKATTKKADNDNVMSAYVPNTRMTPALLANCIAAGGY